MLLLLGLGSKHGMSKKVDAVSRRRFWNIDNFLSKCLFILKTKILV